MQRTTKSSPLTIHIQPPLLATPNHPLFPPPTALLATPPTSPFSPTNSNLIAIAAAIPASSFQPGKQRRGSLLASDGKLDESSEPRRDTFEDEDTNSNIMSGILAVSGTPLPDGTGIAFVFRSLCIREVGEWRVKIIVTEMATADKETKAVGDAVSTTIRVSDQGMVSESERQGHLSKFMGWGEFTRRRPICLTPCYVVVLLLTKV